MFKSYLVFMTDSGRDAPKERPKLNLQPRSKPAEEPAKTESASASAAPKKSSIFGAAKPVDTAAREREIEERLQKQRADEREQVEKEKESRYNRYGITQMYRN